MGFYRYCAVVRRSFLICKENTCQTPRLLATSGYQKYSTEDAKSKRINVESTALQLAKAGYVDKTAVDCQSNVGTGTVIGSQVASIKFVDANDEDDLDIVDEDPVGPLDPCHEDLSYIAPYELPTYNLAKYANDCRTIQELVKLGVEIYKIDKDQEAMKLILSSDFEKDIKPYIQFLHDCGVKADRLGYFITKNPTIFQEDMDDLQTRIRYLRASNFSVQMIQEIVNKHPNWISYSTQSINKRLYFFKSTFDLTAKQVRLVSVKYPQLITYKKQHIQKNTFCVKEEMGFGRDEIKDLILQTPRIWTKSRKNILEAFDYVHNVMNIQHDHIVRESNILLCRKKRIEERYAFLRELNKAQFDPTKPLYVSLLALVSGTDVEFCRDIAKSSVETYNKFIKTL